MRQRLPGQAGNARKTRTHFRHGGIVPAPRRATHRIYAPPSTIEPSGSARWITITTSCRDARSASSLPGMTDAHEVVAAYWTAAEARDWVTFGALLADDVIFRGPQTR